MSILIFHFPLSLFILAYCGDFCKASDSCNAHLDFAPKKLVSIKEDVPAGTNIFTIEVRGSETWTFDLGRSDDVDGSAWTILKTYLAFKRFGSKYEMIVNKTLDLENIFQKNSIQLSTLILILNCKRPGLPTETLELLLQVLPVNEFAPQFVGAPFHRTIPEDTRIGTKLIQMDQVTIDRDINPATRELSRFRIHDYTNASQRDGQPYFSLENVQKGIVVLKNAVDFEALNSLGSTTFMLNVSAADIHGLKAYTQIQIDVTDIDDLPPEFFHPSCPLHIRRLRPCPVSFEAEVPVNYEGRIHNIQPQDIQAHDMDALDAAITYTLYSGPGESKANADKFSIDATTGALNVTSPFFVATHVDLVVVASENTTEAMTTQAPLKVIVKDVPVNVPMVRIENPLRPDSQSTVRQTISGAGEEKDSIRNNPLFLGILIVLMSITSFLIIIIILILVKMKCVRHSTSTVHPVATNESYDQPSSYHFSHDETVVTNALHLPSHASDRLQKENLEQNSEKSTESQMTSKILSSASQIAKTKAQKMTPSQTLLKEQNGPHLVADSPNTTGNKSSESEGETIFSSDPSSLKSSPLPLPISSAARPTSYALAVSSRDDGSENDPMSNPTARNAMSNHIVMRKRSNISNIERGTTSVASSGRRVHTYPVVDRRSVFRKRENTHRYQGSRGRKWENIAEDQLTDRNDKEYRRRSQKCSSQERRIRIPSGVLVMSPSYEDHAIDESGDDDSNDSTLNDEPIIDAFHESPSVFYHETLFKETPVLKARKENNVLSLLPENLQSESDNGEVVTLTKSGRRELPAYHGLRSDHRPSSINTTPEDRTAANKTLQPQPTITIKETDFRSYSPATTGARSTSLIITPDDEMTVGWLRPVSEADAMIRRKKKRRRNQSQHAVDNLATSVSHCQGDDLNREKQKRPSSSSRKAITGPSPQDDIHKHRIPGELGQTHALFKDGNSGFDN